MSDFNNGFNGYNNQTPPNGNGSDYSYNWNGANNNNGNKNNGNKTFIIILIVFALISTVVISAVVAGSQNGIFSGALNSNASGDGSLDVSAIITDTSHPSPEIEYGGEDQDLSNTLTEIYDACAPSCCTVVVKVNGQIYSTGSGFVFDSTNGYIGTNHHVINNGDEISVVFYDGKEYEATLINSDSVTDLAVLKVEGENLKALKIGSSDKLKVGQNVVAIGTPYDQGLAGTMTCGIISGINRNIDITNESGKVVKTMTLIQTDCSINPGNSGGPLIDMAGNVIGVTSLKLVDEQYEGIGFAIPISGAVEIFRKLIAGESIGDSTIATATPKIGVTITDAKTWLAQNRINPGCEYPDGLLIADIEYTCNAYKQGLSRYDIITEFDGERVTDSDALGALLADHKAGDEVAVKVFRFNRYFNEGETLEITFKLDAAE